MNDFFERVLQRYQINTAKDKQNAIYEITQQVVLAGLHRGGFFDKAAFYPAIGGQNRVQTIVLLYRIFPKNLSYVHYEYETDIDLG